ncbi:MAG TPA: transglutaminase domain-containing protein [Spirochaetes bacterium]|nr:transglutaminase domain-containing protein [Spirochaetota bacterium]
MNTTNLHSLALGFFTIVMVSAGSGKPVPSGPSITETVKALTAGTISDEEKIRKIFYFVRDEIKFDWVYPQDIPAEEVLKHRRGVCMQKANLLVAMAREAGLRARFHFMYVRKNALEDFLPAFAYKRWVDPFPHTFPEIYLNGKWVPMEATFDRELHVACLRKNLNFGRYPEMRSISIEFSPDGVKGHQQYFHVASEKSFYGDDLGPFVKYHHESVPWFKRKLQPMIFRKAAAIMKKIREE